MDSTAMEFSFWKEEPHSPVFSELEDQDADVWELFSDEVAKQDESLEKDSQGIYGDCWLPESPGDSCDSLSNLKLSGIDISTRAQLASQLLQDLDEVLIKEEPFADPWYEQKTDLPMFEELPSPTPSLGKEELAGAALRPFAGLSLTLPLNNYATLNTAFSTPAPPAAVLVPLVQQQQQQQPLHHHVAPPPLQQLQPLPFADTQTLLQEFDFVLGKVEQSHGGALTPPQSPPHQQQHFSVAVEYPSQPVVVQPLQPLDDFSALTPNQQQQQLIREVDELVNSPVPAQRQPQQPQQTAESWPSVFAPPSPCTSSSSSCSFSSESNAPASPETDDPEWLPGEPDSPEEAAAPSEQRQQRQQRQQTTKRASKAPSAARKRGSKRGGNPYSSDDKRLRKKEQNKNAATRYRMKKKAEEEEILGEENGLQRTNDDLHAKVADLSQEIRYLKNLMREVFTRRGLIK